MAGGILCVECGFVTYVTYADQHIEVKESHKGEFTFVTSADQHIGGTCMQVGFFASNVGVSRS